ncbi:MAG: formylglycine-generating enzyme family protein [Nitrospirota bacterium]
MLKIETKIKQSCRPTGTNKNENLIPPNPPLVKGGRGDFRTKGVTKGVICLFFFFFIPSISHGLPSISEKRPVNLDYQEKFSDSAGFLIAKEGSFVAQKEKDDMILIPAGNFLMGYDHRMPDEKPMHKVYLKSFYIDKYEVTNKKYEKFVNATGRKPPFLWRKRNGRYPYRKGDHPVTFVDWYDAGAYCRWAGKRLPTEQEWEKTARGTDGRMFPWGNRFDPEKANTPQSMIGDTTPVGSFPEGRSPYGVYDMSGNVWEWTNSWYKPHPGNKKPGENYGEKFRVVKGGSWVDCSFYKCGLSAPSFNRGFFLPKTKNKGFGFRCAKSVKGNK